MTEVIPLLQNIPGGWALTLFILLVFGPPAIFSKTAAEKFGAFGTLARWWRNRPLAKIEQDERETAAEISVLKSRMRDLEEHIEAIQESQRQERKEFLEAAAEDRKSWRKALDDAEKEIEDVRKNIRLRDRSVFALYDWSIRARVAAIEGGVTLPPIPEISPIAMFEGNRLPPKTDV